MPTSTCFALSSINFRHIFLKSVVFQQVFSSRLTFEFPATGGVIPATNFRTVKLLRYVTAWEYFIMACECIFVAFILYYIIEEILEFRKHGIGYLFSVWNILDIIVVTISCVCIGFNIYSNLVVESKLATLLGKPDQFADFTFLGYWYGFPKRPFYKPIKALKAKTV